MALRVIGAGLGRTGTLSLKAALEELGFTQCYHMIELLTHPEQVTYWEAASAGEPVDWDALFEGWEPLCRFLDVPVPEGRPFPHLNDRETFRGRLQAPDRAATLAGAEREQHDR